jgi:hypothetical protein
VCLLALFLLADFSTGNEKPSIVEKAATMPIDPAGMKADGFY